MQPLDAIRTESEFSQYLKDLTATRYDLTLEHYLCALYGLILREQQALVTWQLLARLLTNALAAYPVPFDERWLTDFSVPPSVWDSQLTTSGYEQVQQMLLYQIADLHRMSMNGSLDDPHRYFGIDSPTKHRW